MTTDPDVRGTAVRFGLDPKLLQAVVNAEGNIVRAVQCSIPSITTREKALDVLARSCVHAMGDFIAQGEQQRAFVDFWAKRWAPVGATNDPRGLNVNWKTNVTKGWLAAVLLLVLAAPVSAQPWGYDASWSLPMTVDTAAVKSALDAGKCEQSGIDALLARGVKAAIATPGAPWPCIDCVQWYGKGTGCDGKYQYVSADGPYPKGWEIKWDSASWVDGDMPPPGFGTHHPTRWTFFPFEGPTYQPAPVIPPPPVTVPPVTPPPIPVTPTFCDPAKIDALAAQLAQAKTDIIAAVNEPGWIKKTLSNPYVQSLLAVLGTYLGVKVAQ